MLLGCMRPAMHLKNTQDNLYTARMYFFGRKNNTEVYFWCIFYNPHSLSLSHTHSRSLSLSVFAFTDAEHLSSFSCKDIHKILIFHLLFSKEELHTNQAHFLFILTKQSSSSISTSFILPSKVNQALNKPSMTLKT